MVSRILLRNLTGSRGIVTNVRCASSSISLDGQFTGPSMKTSIPGPKSKVCITTNNQAGLLLCLLPPQELMAEMAKLKVQ